LLSHSEEGEGGRGGSERSITTRGTPSSWDGRGGLPEKKEKPPNWGERRDSSPARGERGGRLPHKLGIKEGNSLWKKGGKGGSKPFFASTKEGAKRWGRT